MLVDVDEHQELLDSIQNDCLNLINCPCCQARLSADLPVLLFFPKSPSPFLFSPAQATSQEQNRRHAQMCEALARQHLRDQWQNEWLREGLPGVTRDQLKVLLAAGRGDALRRAYLQLCLRLYLSKFIAATTSADGQKVVIAHRELLDPIAEEILTEWIDEFRGKGQIESEALLREYRALLSRCRRVGIETAFRESGAGENPDRSPELNRLLLSWYRLLDEFDDCQIPFAIEITEQMLPLIDPAKDSFLFAAVNGYRGQFLLAAESDRNQALAHLETAIESAALLDLVPESMVRFALSLCDEFPSWPSRTHAPCHDRAIRCLESALPRLTLDGDRELVSKGRHTLAFLYAGRLEASPATKPAGLTYEWPEGAVPMPQAPKKRRTRRVRFSKDAPAPSIQELLRFLQDDSPDRYLFRGQTHAYEFVLPSRFRKGVTENAVHGGWVRFSNDAANAAMTQRHFVQGRVRSALMRTFGKGIGNIIAQQYGLSSEVLDVTEDAAIAAFFATRTYPDYAHFVGTNKKRLGVIYRFPKRDVPPSLARLEHRLHSVGMTFEPFQRVVWFRRRVAIPGLAYEGSIEDLRALGSYFKQHGKAEADLMTQSCNVHYSCLNRLFVECRLDDSQTLPELSTSRWARQRGGLCYPVFWHRCYIPANFSVSPSAWPREVFAEPDLIAIKNIVAVTNFSVLLGCETFYFVHGPEPVTQFDREYLWPSSAEDALLAVVENITRDLASDYLQEVCSDPYDPDRGLLDRGYRI
jgi:hypothetical protein